MLHHTLTKVLIKYQNWLQSKSLSPRTITGFVNQISRFLEWLEQEKQIINPSHIDRELIEQYHHHILHRSKKTISVGTLYSRLVELKNFGRFLSEKQVLGFNPASLIKLPTKPRRKKNIDNIPSTKDIQEVLKFIDSNSITGKRDSLLILFAAQTGFRNFEICKLIWDDIYFDESKVFVAGKGGIEEFLPLSSNLLEKFKEYRNTVHPRLFTTKRNSPKSDKTQSFELVFPSKSGLQITGNNLNDIIKTLSKKADIGKIINPKDLRDYFINTLIDSGMGIRDVTAFARHSCIDTTSRWYIAKSGVEKLREAQEKYNSFFDLNNEEF